MFVMQGIRLDEHRQLKDIVWVFHPDSFYRGMPLICYAAEEGDVDVVKELIRRGADVNAYTADGDTALDLALEMGYSKVARILKVAGGQSGFYRTAA
jgi:ankyrin repeat protein